MNRFARITTEIAAAALLSAAWLTSAGCEVIGFVGDAVDSEQDVEFTAKYAGLNGKRVAVLIDAPLDAQYEHPRAVPGLCDLISAGLRESCEGAQILPPNYVVAYQANNVYWHTMDIEDIAKALKVERLVIVDLVEYRLMAPGNSYLWDGVIVGDINVYEADSLDPTAIAFQERLKVRFPPVDGVRRDQYPQTTIEQGLQIKFAQDSVNLFRNYTRKKGDIKDEARQERHRS